MRNVFLCRRAAQRGVAAVECAIILPVFILVLTMLMYFGWICWHYTVTQKAAHDAAIFLARTSLAEIRGQSTGLEIPIAGVARSIAMQELAELNPGISPPFINVLCDGLGCDGFSTPKYVSIVIRVNMSTRIFPWSGQDFGLPPSILLTGRATTEYAGN